MIDQAAAFLKDLEDFNDFAGGTLCTDLVTQLESTYNNNVNILNSANVQIRSDILNLLVIRELDPAMYDALNAELRQEYDSLTNINKDCDPGFEFPSDAVPLSCGDAAQDAFNNLAMLSSDTSYALCFGDYIRGIVDGTCGNAHLDKIEDLQAQITARSSQKDTLIAQLHFDFQPENQDVSIFAAVLEGNYEAAVNNGYVGSAVLMDEKPTVPADCADDVAEFNDQIDQLAEQLKSIQDLIEYMPQGLCGDLDAEI